MRSCAFLTLLVQTSASEDIFIDDGLSLLQLRAGQTSDAVLSLGQVTSEQACRDLATQWGMKLGAFDTLGYGQKFSSNMGSQLAGCWTYTGGPYACMAFYGQGGDEASQLAPPSNGGTAGPRSRLDATMQAQCAPNLAPGDDASATGDPHLTTDTGKHFDISLLGDAQPEQCNEAMSDQDGKPGAGYRGCKAVTKTGKECQRWDSQTPHAHSRNPTGYPGMGLDGNPNYCRNPDGEPGGIWCYTMTSTRWEYCGDPLPTTTTTTTPSTIPQAVEVVPVGDGLEDSSDTASAVGDPHLTTRSGAKHDMSCDGAGCA